jgi:hypothetical protein
MSNYGWWPDYKLQKFRATKDIAFRGLRTYWRIERFFIPVTLASVAFYAYFWTHRWPM